MLAFASINELEKCQMRKTSATVQMQERQKGHGKTT